MMDRGDKIVTLAQELLRKNDLDTPTSQVEGGVRGSNVAICVAAIVAALGGSAVTTWVHEQSRPINKYERVEIQALLLYAAKKNAHSERDLLTELSKTYGVSNLDNLTARDFPAVRRFLQEKAS